MTDERTYVEQHLDDLHADLDAWLRIPSIGGDPAFDADTARSAEWLADKLRSLGFPTVEIWPTEGQPAVFAEWPAEDATPETPTVVVYGHHDVQPVDPLELWDRPPFEPHFEGGKVYARGAMDDKGQIAFHFLGLRAHLAATGRTSPAVNLKFLVEGEEESGSPHFAALLKANLDRLACDVVVVSDTGVFDKDTPSVNIAMRGLVYAELDVVGPEVDLHSGSFGGAVPNPAHVLADLLSGLHDADGRVTIEGFYDKVLPLTDADRAEFAKLPFDEAEWLATSALSGATHGEAGYGTLERLGARPTADVNGMWGGYTGAGQKTIIPAHAHAKVSFRLVADQDPGEISRLVEKHFTDRAPAGIQVAVRFYGDGVRPCLTPIDHPANAAVVRALERAFEQEILYTREGGSGPEADLAEILAAPVVFLGVALPDDRFHAPNERAVLAMLHKGAEAAAYLWSELPGVNGVGSVAHTG